MFAEIIKEMLTLIGGLIVAYFIYIFISRKYDKSTTSTTTMAQMALKDLVERAVEEAKKLPGLRGSEADKEKDQTIKDRSYEDLLATAILNKVIEKFQNDYVDGNRNVLREKSFNCTNSEIATGFENGQEGSSSCLEALSQDECDCGASQAEQHINQSQPLSLTIEERIEEVTTTYASDEGINNEDDNDLDFQNARRVPFPEYGMDIVDPYQDSSDESQEDCIQDLVTPVESWEENWLFQKRKIQARSEPVAMLVPNANAEFRALIGDQNAEDTSDLSECSAQSDEEIDHEFNLLIDDILTPSDLKKEAILLANSAKTKNSILENYEGSLNKETIIEKETLSSELKSKKKDEPEISQKEEIVEKIKETSSVKEKKKSTENLEKGELPDCMKNGFLTEIVNDNHSVDKKVNPKKEKPIINKISNPESKFNGEEEVQQESEYTEHYDTATQKHMDSLTKTYGPMGIHKIEHEKSLKIPETSPTLEKNPGKCRDFAAFIKGETCEKEKRIDATPPRPGTIAEREHKKWENAPPIENNPYSEENIQRRLLERQYSRRSEISESNISKSTEKPLQIVLGAKQLDVKRFGRDYYINDAMTSIEEKQRELGRSSSSLSQHSNSGSDHEQDEIYYDSKASPEKEKSKNWFNDELQSLDSKPSTNGLTHCFNTEVIVSSNNWENSKVKQLSEKERKNNKNEINARLNNQEGSNIHESSSEDKNKKIRRLDLRAYGFENDFRFKNSKTSKSPQQRMVNKLDLKSFGYECGLRRTQSIQLDSRNHSNDQRPKIIRTKNKSNITEEFNNHFDLTKSNEDLNHESYQDGNYFAVCGIVSAKSVPNITDSQLYESNVDVNTIRCKYENKSKFTLCDDKTEDENKNKIRNKLRERELENSIENLSIRSETDKSEEDGSDNSIPILPSVKRLAQAFSKSTEILNPSRVSSNKHDKERPTTPEIQLIETPRQMHSLTARSLSKEFRDGLRQCPKKIISQPPCRGKLEEKLYDNQTISESDKQSLIGDISIISPGKLKNNIQFWEQLQKRN